MKKFRYNMENILQIKLKMEDQAKISYGNARSKLTIEEERLDQLKIKRDRYEDEMRGLRSSKLDLLKIRHCEEAIEIIQLKIKQQTTIVKNSAQRLEVARIRLNNAMIERKTQERLKEKALEEYKKEFEAEERKEFDELSSYHYSPTLDEEDV